VVTHEHADHYHEPFLRAVAQKFPYTPIVTNNDLADEIKKLEIKNPIMTGSDDNIQVFEAAHEPPSWGLQAPSNIGVHIAGQFTHPGDALHIQHSRDILALPITAPFASIKEALEAAIAIKPKVIIPIHDWPWHKQAKGEYYAKAKKYLQTQGVEFIELENAVPVAI
jgi:L-ascorbate metabolism protein UlaG (beta-lactamase superfamily)